MNVIAEAVAQDILDHETHLACVIQPVVLAGGSGTRLWPLSREQCPKQLIGLTGDESLLEATLRRTQGLRAPTHEHPAPHIVRTQPTLVVCSEELKLPTKERVALRLDRDIVDHFRHDGPGWQTRINDALAQLVKRRSK